MRNAMYTSSGNDPFLYQPSTSSTPSNTDNSESEKYSNLRIHVSTDEETTGVSSTTTLSTNTPNSNNSSETAPPRSYNDIYKKRIQNRRSSVTKMYEEWGENLSNSNLGGLLKRNPKDDNNERKFPSFEYEDPNEEWSGPSGYEQKQSRFGILLGGGGGGSDYDDGPEDEEDLWRKLMLVRVALLVGITIMVMSMVSWTTEMAEEQQQQQQNQQESAGEGSLSSSSSSTSTIVGGGGLLIPPPTTKNLDWLCHVNLDTMARNKECEATCFTASCCWNKAISSCVTGNEPICSSYRPCRNYFRMFPADEFDDDITDDDDVPLPPMAHSAPTSNESSPSSSHTGPNKLTPLPPKLRYVCSPNSVVSSQEARNMCESFCHPALCCINKGDPDDCRNSEAEQLCKAYTPLCTNLWIYDGTLPPPDLDNDDFSFEATTATSTTVVPSPLSHLCSDPSSPLCQQTCQKASCCWSTTPSLSCTDIEPLCSLYTPHCPNDIQPSLYLSPLPQPLSNLDDLCSPSSTSTHSGMGRCEHACTFGRCCFEDAAVNCLTKFRSTCELYAICATIPFDLDEVIRPPLEMLCAEHEVMRDEGREECERACLPGACCWGDSEESNCFDFGRNGEVCGEYEACKVLTVVPDAGDDLGKKCGEDMDERDCEEACRQAECCFLGGAGNCRAFNEVMCRKYEKDCHAVFWPNDENTADFGYYDTDEQETYLSSLITNNDDDDDDLINDDDDITGAIQYDDYGYADDLANNQSNDNNSPDEEESDESFTSSLVRNNDDDDDISGAIQYDDFDDDLTNKPNYNNDDLSSIDIDPLVEICSPNHIATPLGRKDCETECISAACCQISGSNGCQSTRKDFCKTMSVCNILKQSSSLSSSSFPITIPPPPTHLNDICSDESINKIAGRRNCEVTCAPSRCCLETNGCYEDNSDKCDEWTICKQLLDF